MSTSPGELENTNNNLSAGFNVAPVNNDPLANFQMLKNWAPQAMNALRQSNLKTQMANPVEAQPRSSGMAKGIISGLLG